MKYKFLTVLALVFFSYTSVAFAQWTPKVEGYPDAESFPAVRFIWHDYKNSNLEELSSQCKLQTRDGVSVPFNIKQTEGNINNGCKVVILWEDMKSHREQSAKTKAILQQYFQNVSDNGTKYYVATFNRKHTGIDLLKPVGDAFSTNTSAIAEAVSAQTLSTETFNTYKDCSDLYAAIEDALKLLEKGDESTKAIIVFTEGVKMASSGSSEENSVLAKAQEMRVPISMICYPLPHGETNGPKNFSEGTHGAYATFNDAYEGVSALNNIMSKVKTMCNGYFYEVTFQSDAELGSGNQVLEFVNPDNERESIQISVPDKPNRFAEMIRANRVLVIVLAVVFLLAIAALVYMLFRNKQSSEQNMENYQAQTNKAMDDERERMMAKQQALKEEMNAKIKEQEEQLRRQEEQRRREKEEEANRLRQKQAQDELQRLQNLMHTKNIFPQLKCYDQNGNFVYNVRQVVVNIGRLSSNDVVFTSDTVSREHMKIEFDGTGFILTNKKPENPVKVNGQPVQKAVLSNGDVVTFGYAQFVFFL